MFVSLRGGNGQSRFAKRLTRVRMGIESDPSDTSKLLSLFVHDMIPRSLNRPSYLRLNIHDQKSKEGLACILAKTLTKCAQFFVQEINKRGMDPRMGYKIQTMQKQAQKIWDRVHPSDLKTREQLDYVEEVHMKTERSVLQRPLPVKDHSVLHRAIQDIHRENIRAETRRKFHNNKKLQKKEIKQKINKNTNREYANTHEFIRPKVFASGQQNSNPTHPKDDVLTNYPQKIQQLFGKMSQ